MISEINERLTLIGTAHILPKSVKEVRELIKSENPDIICVELDHNRYIALTTRKRERERSGNSVIPSEFGRILRFIQDKFAKKTGSPAGEDMLAAIEASREIGAQIELIDRDIRITLNRFMRRLGLFGRLKLIFQIIASLIPFGEKIDLENITEEEVVKKLINELREFSEPAYNVLIEERNNYMAEKITRLMKSSSGKIICVVGAGHVPGLQKELKKRDEIGEFEPWEKLELEI